MAKIVFRKLTRDERKNMTKELCSTFMQLPRRKDVITLLIDILTPSEQVMFARRIQVAKKLIKGDTYLEIREKLGVGFDMIQRVNSWLDKHFEEYREVLPHMIESADNEPKKTKYGKRKPLGDPLTFEGMRRRYPDKFALINMLLDDD